MRDATAAEYSKATCISHAEKRIIESKRSQTVVWSVCGKPIAEKTTIFKNRKPISVTYQVA